METHMSVAVRIVNDVLTLRGPDTTDGPFRMVTTPPELFMTPARLELAKRFADMVPRGATTDDVARIAATIAPVLEARA